MTDTFLAGDEVLATGEAADKGLARKAAEAWYKKNLQGQTIETAIGPVRLSGAGGREMRSWLPRAELARVVPAIPDILRHGSYQGSMPNRDPVRKPRVSQYHRFDATVMVNGESLPVFVLVEEREGKFFYNLFDNISPPTGSNPLRAVGRPAESTDAANEPADGVREDVPLD